jgi:hypothetical protein
VPAEGLAVARLARADGFGGQDGNTVVCEEVQAAAECGVCGEDGFGVGRDDDR